MNRCPTCHRGYLDSEPACPLDGAPLVPGEGTLPAELGRTLGPYRLVGLLGEGGMGSLYVAAHTRLDRHVAIKLMRPELASRREEIARFFDEAAIVSAIQHPNIVASIDTVEGADGVYCVLELLRGASLAERLAGGPRTMADAIAIGAQIADALVAVHDVGVVHRDLKPDNIILVPGADGDVVKLIDFGVAQRGAAVAGAPVGTAAYMSPEQGAGEPVDGRTDLYSLGVILFEMVVGRHPFPSTTDHEYLVRHAHDAVPRASRLASTPRALEAIIARCLRKRPGDRYASATEVAEALRAIDLDHDRGPRGRAWMWAAGGLGIAVVAAALVVPSLVGESAPPPRTASPPAPPPVRRVDVALEPGPTVAVAKTPVPREEPYDEIELAIASTPGHATVYRAGETVALGTTPFAVKLARAERTIELRFELAGHVTKTVEVSLAESAEVATRLAVVPRRPKPGPRGTTVPREGVIDPFAPRR